jgi:hypothetical protein
MGIATILMATAFVGNGYTCFGSPDSTGDILPTKDTQYITRIAALLEGRSHAVVGWVYISNTGQRFVQTKNENSVGTSGVRPFPGTANRGDLSLFECNFPMTYEPFK